MKKSLIHVPAVFTRGIVLFPHNKVDIEVGRALSIKSVEIANEKFEGLIFLVCQKDIMIDEPSQEDVYTMGTLAKVTSVRQKEGFLRVTFQGLDRAGLTEVKMMDGYQMAAIEIQPLAASSDDEEEVLVHKLMDTIGQLPQLSDLFPVSAIEQVNTGIAADEFTDLCGQFFLFKPESRQYLLELGHINDRLYYLLEEVNKALKYGEVEQFVNEKVKDRIDDNQREFYLREKLKAIREELGDVPSSEDDSDNFREMINSRPYPSSIKKKALEELRRYEMMPAGSGETSVSRNYIEWLLNVPWWQETEDLEDLKEVRASLDARHYGLEKVKDRVMEYLAVKKMTNSLKAPILCLVGPPGVGKTSLAKSIADAMHRKFVKMSVGGVKDEAEIRGHRRTYLGAMPGRIIQGMRKAEFINPLFLIDEIDKLGADYKGDPSDALLEVLDPEQNAQFSDHYLEEAYDLSKVMFIATANYLENIPAPLRDRLEIIELPSYTEVDKVEIARQHLIPLQVKTNGLKPSQFKLKDKEILYLIRHYTREAGVRQLERLIGSLCRKTVLEILNENKKSLTMTKSKIEIWLGKPIFDYGSKEKKNEVGVVTGLAYTQFGGDVLQIEVNFFAGKGGLIITGQLGDVMKESAHIALDYVKAHADEFKIDPKFFEQHDIHIHVPEGAVPKDGPSAGITLTTALVSAITNRPVRKDIAMTGEVTLRGNVLAIGGLREKSLAAHRVGIHTILIPEKNLRDLEEVPELVKKDITFIPVKQVHDVLKETLV
ncbi:endopeptidase La [Bulleidia sp. zg-1006]|uniref:endopeptidase La n=1 Tax=Bulleidia sp. zg-1006 TaxID=2806552 RepID=UPI00193AA7F3|nr:endopeptidase La [Bulleidia sp. zg-1006]QRG87407.1 endopeptidase La [Bulleidia sp. zg-1006]